MEIIDIKTIIEKWEMTGNVEDYVAPIKEGERLGYTVGRYLGGESRHCIITADIHISTLNTDFILDIDIQSNIEFKTDGTPKPQDIYDLYSQAKAKWRYEILKRGQAEGFNNPTLIIEIRFVPFETQINDIEKAIVQSLVSNN